VHKYRIVPISGGCSERARASFSGVSPRVKQLSDAHAILDVRMSPVFFQGVRSNVPYCDIRSSSARDVRYSFSRRSTNPRATKTDSCRLDGKGTFPMGLLLLVILVLLLVGGLPTWPYSRRWGYGPSGALGTLLMILLILVMLDYVPRGF
jgi:hypothetical protein